MPVKVEEVARLRADEAMLRANLARQRELLASSDLVVRDGFDAALFREARRVRDLIMGAPNRYAAELAAQLEVDQFLTLQVLIAGVRQLLELAAGSGPFPEPQRAVSKRAGRRRASTSKHTDDRGSFLTLD